MKKVLAIVLVLLIMTGWVLAFLDLGPSLQDRLKLGLDFKGGVYVVMEAQTEASGAELAKLMEQTQTIIEDRVNQMGLSEPVVTVEGEKKIRVELPGAEILMKPLKLLARQPNCSLYWEMVPLSLTAAR